ncbi:hypothetical protein CAI21_11310 [Alkalilimnicola ehrlichii]|uniref:CobQ/CobB/MinD/ParA nucleotide binding domain-containing protein n=1 Tax=Alkalilimnicola ehrlichii TaxID=351052 RepID=A0A3E0X2S4_9GAMM|nr:ParA family protein [Alkalilimnicola ehrlichii]RFA29026.1 hypothetical protein CAI21_11310 [Alkalilimnicola ehrlichii]RFA38662.1 hypothetical protein CAL65_04860 [Alkalilimnicola ehrlichii]
MRRIIVLNSKGGCGKTTISTNLASQYAARGYKTALIDNDPQGSSLNWLSHRPGWSPEIKGINAFAANRGGMTRSWALRTPPDTERVILDTPASLLRPDYNEHLRGVNLILIPVQPSSIDVHAAANFIRDLLLVNKVDRYQERVGIIANRSRQQGGAFEKLERFLASLKIPVLAHLRDTMNYVRAAEQGLGVHEIDASRAQLELEAWDRIIEWLERDQVPGAYF